jgi:hypothetical protein
MGELPDRAGLQPMTARIRIEIARRECRIAFPL